MTKNGGFWAIFGRDFRKVPRLLGLSVGSRAQVLDLGLKMVDFRAFLGACTLGHFWRDLAKVRGFWLFSGIKRGTFLTPEEDPVFSQGTDLTSFLISEIKFEPWKPNYLVFTARVFRVN